MGEKELRRNLDFRHALLEYREKSQRDLVADLSEALHKKDEELNECQRRIERKDNTFNTVRDELDQALARVHRLEVELKKKELEVDRLRDEANEEKIWFRGQVAVKSYTEERKGRQKQLLGRRSSFKGFDRTI